jgi:hypothetical protein
LFTRRIYKIHVVTSPDADLIQHVRITNAATPFSLSSREREFVISLPFLRTNNSDDVGTILALNDFNLFPILSAAHKYNQTRLLSQNDVLLSMCAQMRNDDSRHQTNNIMAQLSTLVFSVQLLCFLMILLTWPNYSTAADRFTTNEDGEINQLRNSVVSELI